MRNVIYHISQSFADIGSEDKTNYEPEIRDGAMRPTAAINQVLAEIDAQVTTAIICGNNFMSTYRDEAIERILTALGGREFDLFLAGLAFQAGHHGVVCGETGKTVSARFGIPAITSMHAENPGVEMFKKDTYVMTGSHSAANMKKSAGAMIELADKLLKGQTPEGPDTGGYYARGIHYQAWREDGVAATDRTVDMLIAKATGQSYQSELIVPKKDLVPIAPVLKDLEHARVASASTGGIVPVNSPDRIQPASAIRWGRYDTSKMDHLAGGEFKAIRAGFGPVAVDIDPNVIMPVDVMKEFLNRGKYGSLHDYFHSIVGTGTIQGEARRMAKEVTPLLREDHVDAVIMVSTRGTCTCCGSAIVKEFKHAGFPVVLMCNLLPAAQTVGVNRMIPIVSISYPLGDPSTPKEEQHLLRRPKVETVLDAPVTDTRKQTIFKVEI